MSKLVTIVGIVLVAIGLFVASLVVFVNMRGGVAGEDSTLAKLPVLGGLVKVRAASEEPGSPAPAAAVQPLGVGREATFLRFGPEAELVRLADELREKKAEYDVAKQELERRTRELSAWQQQIEEERTTLRDRFAKEKAELAAERQALAAKEAQINARQVAITAVEQSNLKKTAEIYGKMEAEKAAEMLASLFANGQEETVVKIIYLMQDRNAAKLLAAFADPAMGATITERLKDVGREVQQGG